MNVLIILEDFRKDQYVVKPVIKAMLAELGKPRANVIVCMDPLLGGVDQALEWTRIEEILDRYKGMVQLFFLLVDRDGVAGRRSSLDSIEGKAKNCLPAEKILLGENAWQEIEVWALAGHALPSNWAWTNVRTEVNPKEVYFEPYAAQRGLTDEPGGGRKTLGQEAAAYYKRMRQLCPEDIQCLERRLEQHLKVCS